MGNYTSCTLPGPVARSSARGTKVILPSGELRRIHEPTKAAELMVEAPNYFLVNAESLRVGRRFSALNADEDLEMGNTYGFFPMKRLNSAATAADMETFSAAAKPGLKRVRVRILPECGQAAAQQAVESIEKVSVPKLNLDNFEQFSALEIKHRLSVCCRSKRPLLETIMEEPAGHRR
ncbi:hypothetical protein F511_09713 [Dorcoceras hygrometricum]|uniref:Uncharacterized protein n=1 Tax=Dorcoceras hygrometricum TaxID=472368 RepID=A0A2Z7CRC5_9LAMI|nr:hypothetical protein F511_09713 [Dorcoceras hygrometricum]